MEAYMSKKKENFGVKFYIIIGIITLFVIILIAFAFSKFNKNQNKMIEENSGYGKVSMTYSSNYNGLKLNNENPLNDSDGMILAGKDKYFDFTISTKIVGNRKVDYKISLVKDASSTLADKDVKVYLQKQKNGTYETVVKPITFDSKKSSYNMVIYNSSKIKSSNDKYRLRIWVSNTSTDYLGKYFGLSVKISGKES